MFFRTTNGKYLVVESVKKVRCTEKGVVVADVYSGDGETDPFTLATFDDKVAAQAYLDKMMKKYTLNVEDDDE